MCPAAFVCSVRASLCTVAGESGNAADQAECDRQQRPLFQRLEDRSAGCGHVKELGFCRRAAERLRDLFRNLSTTLLDHMAEVSVAVPAQNRSEPAVTDCKLPCVDERLWEIDGEYNSMHAIYKMGS